MGTAQPIHPLFIEAQKSSREEFLAKHTDPLFVVDPHVAEEDIEQAFQTQAVGRGDPTGTRVAWIRKAHGSSALDFMITIGRARSNDIELDAPDVSKFHAFLVPTAEGWELGDAGSRFGTLVDDRELKGEDARAPLTPGSRVAVGSVSMTFHVPETFHDYLMGKD
ncbi:MAG: FHA domain-containing protein [Planctomycetes bacterium]|nr:FHA domain-containing protein [Planctomycetota bacterium]